LKLTLLSVVVSNSKAIIMKLAQAFCDSLKHRSSLEALESWNSKTQQPTKFFPVALRAQKR
jgi:hypothetical protein